MKKLLLTIAVFVISIVYGFATPTTITANATVGMSVAHHTPTIAWTGPLVGGVPSLSDIVLYPGAAATTIPLVTFTVSGGDAGCSTNVSAGTGWSGGLTNVTIGGTGALSSSSVLETGGTVTYSGQTAAAQSGAAIQPNTVYTLTLTISNW